MATRNNRVDVTDRVVPSLLDRLTDDEPDKHVESGAARLQTIRELKASLWRDLAWLLNTKRGEDDIPEEYEELNDSVAMFGVPDFTSLSLKNPNDQSRLRRGIEGAIRRFEPRLMNAKVSLEDPENETDPVIRFRVDALLKVDPDPEPISFDTVVQADTGQLVVAGEKR